MAAPEKKENTTERAHRATYSADKRKGGWLIRVEGPHANMFAGREVPVTLTGGKEHVETLVKVVWTGKDKESGKPVCLYSFEPKPIEVDEVLF